MLLALGITAAGTSAGGTWGPFSDAVELQVPSAASWRALALVNAGSPVGLIVASGLVMVVGDEWRAAWWVFAAIGLVAAVAAWRVLTPGAEAPAHGRARPPFGWFVNRHSVRLLVVALAVMLVLLGGSTVTLLLAPGSLAAALASAALFGVGFTTGFALVVMWSQEVFHAHPTTGFTLTIVCIAIGFIVGPSLFGVLATRAGRPTALLLTAAPALLVALVPPSRDDRPGQPS